jgi:predicted nucleic-acid-binding protein
MRAVDTNVLVRLLARDDPAQTAAAEEYISNAAWASAVAVAEAIWVLGSVYGRSAVVLCTSIELLLDLESVMLQDREAILGALDVFRARPGLGFSDCLILVLARQSGNLPLGTFDRALAKLAGTQKL